MEKFLKRHELPKLTEEEIESLTKHIPSKEIDIVIEYLPTRKSPDSDSLVSSFKYLK